jgi:hypothetical protein
MDERTGPGLGSRVLAQVQEGMDVYDATGSRVGSVERVYLGGADERTIERGGGPATAEDPSQFEHSFLHDLARAFAPDELPETLRARLLRHGFIRIDAAGLFAADRYVTPSQVDHVDANGVHLRSDWKGVSAA